MDVVIGAGVAGLTAAHALAAAGAEVLVLEGSPVLGGKLRLAEVAGVPVDVGAEAMLNRRPEGVDLARALDLPLVHPAPTSSRLWTRGDLRPLPRSLMGVPLDVEQLRDSGVLSAAGLARVLEEPSLPAEPVEGDVSVGDLVGRRFGTEVVDQLVEPLLGGVYAGHARLLSARAAVPQLVSMAGRGSLLEQAAALPSSDAPVFAGVPGGMGRLPAALARAVESRGGTLRTGAVVRRLRATASGYRLTVGPTVAPEQIDADRVVLATPAAPTARLLAEVAPEASDALGRVESASVAVVTLAVRTGDAAPLDALASSGFLVPPAEGRRIKASTFSFAKWGWVREAGEREGVLHLRTSLGRHREEAALQARDEDLVAWSLAELAQATGVRLDPVDTHVQRWGGGLPQYAVGHLDLVARARAGLPDGLAVAGAAYDGVGIPAVIASARVAVERLLQRS